MAKAVKAEIFEYPDGVELRSNHPGLSLADELAARDLTANALALKLRVPANRLTDIIRGKRAISAETALRLGRYFGTRAFSDHSENALAFILAINFIRSD